MTNIELNRIVRCLAGQANDHEQEELKDWLQEAGNRIQYEEFRAIWMASTEIYKAYAPDLGLARKKIENGTRRTLKLKLWTWAGRAAAVLILGGGLFWAVTEYSVRWHSANIAMTQRATGPALDSVTLSDGSRVWLNKETTLKFPQQFNGSERRVFLTGEAFFEVAHNPKMPFVVEAAGTVTEVLGTSFNIKTSKADVSVAVRTGKVLFSEHNNAANFTTLQKNEMGAFTHADNQIKTSAIDGGIVPSWKNRRLFFKNTPLWQVVEKLSAFYQTPIRLDPAIPANLRLTSSFDDQGVEEVLEVVCATLDLKLEHTAEGYRLERSDASD